MNDMKFKLELEISVDPNFKVTVTSTKTTPILSGSLIIETGKITESTFKYGLISFASKSFLADELEQIDKIQILYKGALTTINVGSKRGRLVGLTTTVNKKSFLDNFNTGDNIELRFDKQLKIIELVKQK